MSATKVGDWFSNWHPVTIPLLLLVLKIGITLKLGLTYRFAQFPADVAYYGVTFYVWALTTKSGGATVCPRGMGTGEWNFVIFFLIMNFAVYFLAFPSQANVSYLRALSFTFLALMSGFGSPVFLRWR
jgi:hypothetical protein